MRFSGICQEKRVTVSSCADVALSLIPTAETLAALTVTQTHEEEHPNIPWADAASLKE